MMTLAVVGTIIFTFATLVFVALKDSDPWVKPKRKKTQP